METLSHVWQYTDSHRVPLTIGAIVVGATLLSRALRFFLNRYFHESSRIIRNDPTQYHFIKNGVSFIIFVLALVGIFYTIPELRALGVTLFAGAGIFAAILGLAAQQAFANIASGTFIVIFKPFRVHDIIQIGADIHGEVEDITLRHTVIRNFENKRVIIPNSSISTQTIVNHTLVDEKICRFVEFTVGFETDVSKAKRIMQAACEAHPLCLDNRTPEEQQAQDPKVSVRVIRVDDYGLRLRAWAWAATPGDAFVLHCDLNEQIKAGFEAQGVALPYPTRTVVNR